MPSLPENQGFDFATGLRAILADRQITQEKLAVLTQTNAPPGVEIATIQRALRGKVTDKTARVLEKTLDVGLLDTVLLSQAVSDEQFGGYAYSTYKHYVGDYVCARYTFGDSDEIYVYHLSIDWDQRNRCLRYNDRNKFGGDYSQTGYVCIPPGSQYLHLLTLTNGSCRLITATHLVGAKSTMRGAILTAYNPQDPFYIPAVAPIVIHQVTDEDPISLLAGPYDRNDPDVSTLAELLKEAAKDGVVAAFGS